MKKLPYRNGDVFALPLRDRGYAIGLIARAGPRGRVIFGYFFGIRFADVPTLDQLPLLTVRYSVLLGRFGDLHLMNGRWTVLGRLPRWTPDDWPMPPFVRHEPISNRKFEVFYSDADPGRIVREVRLPADAPDSPPDRSSGAGAVEIRLTRILAGQREDSETPSR